MFQRAADLPPAERARFLAAACAGDEALRREVESRLPGREMLPAARGLAARALELSPGNLRAHSLLGVEKLAKLEQKLSPEQKSPQSRLDRFYVLSKLAKAAFDAGDLDKAEFFAKELLSMAPEYQSNWNYGSALFSPT